MKSQALPLILAALLFGCATGYEYAPATTTSAEIAGHPASSKAIPADAPRGEVRVAMLGVAFLGPGLKPTEDRALHIAMAVSNRSDEVWQVKPSDQRVELRATDGWVALGSAASPGGSPSVDVPPGESRTIDVYFLVPNRFQTSRELPAFNVLWTVRAGSREVTERTSFERFPVRTDR